jgi:hypothetical protein
MRFFTAVQQSGALVLWGNRMHAEFPKIAYVVRLKPCAATVIVAF